MQIKFQKFLLFVLFHCRRRKEKTSQVMEKLVACRVSDLFTEPLSKRHCTGSRVRAPRFQRVTIKWKANSWMSLKSAFQIIGKPQCMSHLWIGASRKSSWRHVARGGKKHQPQNKQTQWDSCSSPVCSICHGADSKHRKSADYGGNDWQECSRWRQENERKCVALLSGSAPPTHHHHHHHHHHSCPRIGLYHLAGMKGWCDSLCVPLRRMHNLQAWIYIHLSSDGEAGHWRASLREARYNGITSEVM